MRKRSSAQASTLLRRGRNPTRPPLPYLAGPHPSLWSRSCLCRPGHAGEDCYRELRRTSTQSSSQHFPFSRTPVNSESEGLLAIVGTRVFEVDAGAEPGEVEQDVGDQTPPDSAITIGDAPPEQPEEPGARHEGGGSSRIAAREHYLGRVVPHREPQGRVEVTQREAFREYRKVGAPPKQFLGAGVEEGLESGGQHDLLVGRAERAGERQRVTHGGGHGER